MILKGCNYLMSYFRKICLDLKKKDSYSCCLNFCLVYYNFLTNGLVKKVCYMYCRNFSAPD
jgi:hypothetical protein